LLFAVNGGAFAIAALGAAKLGNLKLEEIAAGLIFFTVVMGFDIAAFGVSMRKRAKRAEDCALNAWEGVFSLIGWAVLVLLCLLIIVGWILAAH
jgi:hypothetical protein